MIGNPPFEAPAGSAATGRYAVLVMDSLRLLIPQNQVQTLEPGFDVQHTDTGGMGWITVAGARLPVYCLSEDLKPLRKVPASRLIFVLLDSGAGLFGVLCDEVTMFEQVAPEITPLPACMVGPDMPLRGLMLHGEQVLCVGSADDLLACLDTAQEPALERGTAQLLSGGVA